MQYYDISKLESNILNPQTSHERGKRLQGVAQVEGLQGVPQEEGLQSVTYEQGLQSITQNMGLQGAAHEEGLQGATQNGKIQGVTQEDVTPPGKDTMLWTENENNLPPPPTYEEYMETEDNVESQMHRHINK